MKKKHILTIAGSTLTVVSDEDEKYVKSLGSLLDRRVSELVINKGRCTKPEALMLCALDYLDTSVKLAEEVKMLKEEINELKKKR